MQKFHSNLTQGKFLVLIASIFISIIFIIHQMFFSIDQYFVVALFLTFFIRKPVEFIKDWLPFGLLFLSFEYLRGALPHLSKLPHVTPMIFLGGQVFGTVATVGLQSALFTPGIFTWYDYFFVLVFLTHFVIPFNLALYFWLFNKPQFKSFTKALLLLSYLALITFVIFPAMPPWLAAQNGYLPHVYHIINRTLRYFSPAFPIPTVYAYVPANLVAAVPSLHAAYPTLTFLFLFKRVPKWVVPILVIYVLTMWFAVIYLGEHYFIDVVLGAVYAFASYKIVEKFHRTFKIGKFKVSF